MADRVIHEAHIRGTEVMSVKDILAQSSNIGTITIAEKLGQGELAAWIDRFGFGKPTGVDYPGESRGLVLPLRDWSGSTIGTVPIGQGIAVTPLQMVSAYATIGNGGVRVTPHLVEKVGTKRVASTKGTRVVSRHTADRMMSMFRDVVLEGTGTEAAIPGYTVAGKTGTAQKAENGRYVRKYVASFVGLVPAKKPRLAILVMVDEPRGNIYGGVVAAPAFRDIARFSLQYLEVPPDAPETKTAQTASAGPRTSRDGLSSEAGRCASVECHPVNLDDLTRVLAASETGARGAVEITDLAYDADRVGPGTLFFCVPGARVDGHEFAARALAAGAAALVVERPLELDVPQLLVDDARAAMSVAADRFFGEPTRSLEVAGVTGTNGKTTTAFLMRSVLEAAGRSPGLVGTVDWIVGGASRAAPHTTPEAIDLQRLFREMLDAGDESVVVEASSHGSVLHRLDRVRFDVLVFTNLSQDHLDLHGTMEDYYQAKRRLFTGAQPPPAAVNVGDEHGRRLALELAESRRAPLVTYGMTDSAEIRPDDLELGPSGSRFRAGGIEVETPLRGRFNVENILGVIAAGLLLDVDDDDIADGVRALRGVPGRFEAVDEGQPFAVIVDYAHTPDSLDIVLQAARELGEGRLICVFGAGGDRDRGKRPVMGAVAVQRADHVSSRLTIRAAKIRSGSSRTCSREPGPPSRSIRTGAARSGAPSRLPSPATSS